MEWPAKYTKVMWQVKSSIEKKKKHNEPLTSLECHHLRWYDILIIGEIDKLIEKEFSDEDHI